MLKSGGQLQEEQTDRGNSRCKHPETGPCLGSLRNGKEAVAREENSRA